MRILFLNPPFIGRFSRASRSPAVALGGTLYYPIWLAYAAGLAEKSGHHVMLVDAPAEGISARNLPGRLKGFVPDLIVVETSTPSINSDVLIAEKMGGVFDNAFVLLVGTHPSALPRQTLLMSRRINAAAIGEYDQTVCDIAGAIERGEALGGVDGIAYRYKDEINLTGRRKKIADLDSIPFVSSVYRRHLDVRRYFFAAANHPMVMIVTGRGCPHRCFFCVYPQVFHGHRYRVRSVENVVEELLYIKRRMPGIKEVGIEDDSFTADKKRVAAICEAILKKNIRIDWYCNARGDLDYPLLKLMKRAGCRLVTVGFESGVQRILDRIDKGLSVEVYKKFIDNAKRAGMLVHGCIMVGNPLETKSSMEASFRFALKSGCDSMQFYPLFLYPGTRAYAWAEENGYLMSRSFDDWLTPEGYHRCIHSLPGLTADDMMSFCKRSYARYHLRPAYLLSKAAQAVLRPKEGVRSLKSGGIYLVNIFKLKRRAQSHGN